MTKYSLLLTTALALAPVFLTPPAAAQLGSRPEEQTFDYDPGAEKAGKIQQSVVETTYEDAEVINHPIYGTIILSKHRWRNWVTRSLYLTLVNIALLAIILSLSRTEEYSLIIGYILTGISATLSFWVFLCAVLIIMLKATAWIYVMPTSLVTAAAGYIVLMRLKKSDISLSELKESFQKMRSTANEDPRLVSISGAPGDWPDEDFIK